MPGRSPYDAFSAFVDPLTEALKCVATVKDAVTPGGKTMLGREHGLFLTGNANEGFVKLKASTGGRRLEFKAQMRYRIIEDDRKGFGPYRITTRAYDYTIQTQDKSLVIAYHWHPTGLSHVTTPHLHLGVSQLQHDAVLSEKGHYPTGRVTLENVIAVAIENGAQPLHSDWQEILHMCEAPHLRYRSWHANYELETGEKLPA